MLPSSEQTTTGLCLYIILLHILQRSLSLHDEVTQALEIT